MNRQTRQGPITKKLGLVMVGLPARGKTFVARKLARYLSWLGYQTAVFNVGDYRRAMAGAKQPASFFDPDNRESWEIRERMAMMALDDLCAFFDDGGEVGIYDATNTERARREVIEKRLRDQGADVVFIESICEDQNVVEENVRENKLRSPDYLGVDPEAAVEDFRARIAHYEKTYQPIQGAEKSYVKLVDVGRQVVVNRVDGYLIARLVFFLMNIHPSQRQIWLARHGESRFNLEERIGGDSELSPRGVAYAGNLASFFSERVDEQRRPVVWVSSLVRALNTAAPLASRPIVWRELDEIDAGQCDGLSYEEVRERFPEEFQARRMDKFRYRYPRGESYGDVIQRLERVIVELERERRPVLVIAHQAVVRALYGYLMGRPQEECPHLSIPLHVLVQLTPTAYGYEERRIQVEPAVE